MQLTAMEETGEKHSHNAWFHFKSMTSNFRWTFCAALQSHCALPIHSDCLPSSSSSSFNTFTSMLPVSRWPCLLFHWMWKWTSMNICLHLTNLPLSAPVCSALIFLGWLYCPCFCLRPAPPHVHWYPFGPSLILSPFYIPHHQYCPHLQTFPISNANMLLFLSY